MLGGPWFLAAFALSLAPTAFFALTWRERLRGFARESRAFLRLLADRNLRQRLLARRRALVEELGTLARRGAGRYLSSQILRSGARNSGAEESGERSSPFT